MASNYESPSSQKKLIWQFVDSIIYNLFKFVAHNPEEKFELIATSIKNAKAVLLL